jgi:hypothetical protein
MRYWLVSVLLVTLGAANLAPAQAPQGTPSPPQAAGMSLEAAAQEWLGRAESGDLIPAWNVKEPPQGIPPAYDVAPAVVKDARTRCRFHSERERRALLLCLQIFGAYTREDTPRVGLRLQPHLPPPPPPPRPPEASVIVR